MRNVLNTSLLVVTLLLIGTAVAAFGGVFLPYATPVYAVGCVLALLWAAKLLFLEPVSWTRSPMHWPVILFAGYAVARYFTSPIEYPGRIELLSLGLCVLVYFVAATTFRRRSDRTALVMVLAILAFGESLDGLWQFVTHHSTVFHLAGQPQYEGRGTGSFFNPNHLAGFLEIAFCLLLAHVVVDRFDGSDRQRHWLRKIFYVYCAAFAVAGLYATLSRGAWISAGVGVLAILLWCWRSRDLPPRVVDAALIAVLILGVLFVNRPALRERFREVVTINPDYTFESSPIEFQNLTGSGRVFLWISTWQMIRDHPLWGVGPGTWQWMHAAYRHPRSQGRPEYAHGDLLQLAAEYGSIGWLLAVATVGCFFWQVARLVRQANSPNDRALAIGSAAAVTALVVHSLVDFNLHIPANAMILAALGGTTVALGSGDNTRFRDPLPRPAKWSLALALVALAVLLGWTGVRTTLASHAVWRGNDLRQTFEWDDALEQYARALELDPRSPSAFAEVGELYRLRSALAEGDDHRAERERLAREAAAAFEKSVQLNSRDSEIFLRLGSAYELAADPARARQAYQQALQIDPNNGFTHLRFGVFCDRNNERENAALAFTKAVELTGDPTARLFLKALGQNHP